MLLEQTRRADELQEKLREAEEKLQERTIAIENAGSIANAALKLNKVFEAADAAVAQYIESVKKMGGAAHMTEVPKAAEGDKLSELLSEYKKAKPAVHTFESEPYQEPEKPAERPTANRPIEIKHLKK